MVVPGDLSVDGGDEFVDAFEDATADAL